MKVPNPPRDTAVAWCWITGLSVFGVFAPSIFGMDGFNGGFAISFICGFLAIIGIIVMVIYFGRAATLDRIFTGKDLLAHWTYPREEWVAYAEAEYKRERKWKTQLFWIVAVMALLAGGGCFIFDQEAGGVVFLVMLGLVAIIAFVAFFTSWYNYRQNLRYNGEAFIAPYAVYLNRQLHTWNSLAAWLESVELKDEKQPYLQFRYMAPTRTGLQSYDANVPVPKGKEEEARALLEKFTTGKKDA